VNGLKLLHENDRVREMLQEHFLHVLVDEYQDTNGLQAEFTDILAAKHRNIMAVGDDFQCIYTWRGAKFENIREFPSRWPDCKVLKLERNYRSVAPILDVANTVMKDVPHEFEKTLRPFRTGGAPKPRLYNVWDGRAQAEAIVEKYSCRAGTSEHQSGLCADLHNQVSANEDYPEIFANTPEGKWITENCWKFGFVLRFPPHKTEITGINYESWHFRYVGRYHAYLMNEKDMCLEEYVEYLAQQA
jgi:hypothetical protein